METCKSIKTLYDYNFGKGLFYDKIKNDIDNKGVYLLNEDDVEVLFD